jgi:hypothetical protein
MSEPNAPVLTGEALAKIGRLIRELEPMAEAWDSETLRDAIAQLGTCEALARYAEAAESELARLKAAITQRALDYAPGHEHRNELMELASLAERAARKAGGEDVADARR